jgi:hypothetical protein
MKRRHMTSKPPIVTDVLIALTGRRPMFVVSTLGIVGLIAVARLVLGWAMESS